jgi:hypothetical protein
MMNEYRYPKPERFLRLILLASGYLPGLRLKMIHFL